LSVVEAGLGDLRVFRPRFLLIDRRRSFQQALRRVELAVLATEQVP
jgi:hypothetical protein